MVMRFSYSQVWNETVDLLRSNAAIVLAMAGVFIFLPMLLASHFLPPPTTDKPAELIDLWREYVSVNWYWLVLHWLVSAVGAISLLLLFLDARGRSVGALIAAAILILPFYFVASLISGLIVCIGLLFLIVPGLYLLGRLVLVGPEVVVAGQRNPITAISRSFELTKGNGWAVLGLILLVWIAGAVIVGVIGMLLGIIFLSAAGQDIGTLLTQIVQSLGSTVLEAVLIALIAALYRRLSGPASVAAAGD
jgi:hypothetical protein